MARDVSGGEGQGQLARELEEFEKHLRDTCGTAHATREGYVRVAEHFLRVRYGDGPIDLGILSAEDVVRFVVDYAARVKPGTGQWMTTCLRAFLRYLQLRGQCPARLVAAVPTVSRRRSREQVPKLLTDEQLDRLLAAFDHGSPQGRRDYAITLCLVRLGLRGGEVARLTLDDIDWREGVLRIQGGKGRRTHVLPLPVDVGRAIAAYLRTRPRAEHRRIFVRHRSHVGAPIDRGAVQRLVRRAHERGSVGAAAKGINVLRHTAATRLLRAGASLKEIADILGHRSLDSTMVYAKVDVSQLVVVALPWPEPR